MNVLFRLISVITVAIGSLFMGSSYAYERFNLFAYERCQKLGTHCVQVQLGESWVSLFSNPTHRLYVQKYNRQQYEPLRAEQWLVVPAPDTAWGELSPLPDRISEYDSREHVIVFAPALLAWGHYGHGTLLRWGPAVGGRNWCANLDGGRGGPCRTESGRFIITEAADANRRSSALPVGCADDPQTPCALMPFFSRINNDGQGFHDRKMNGAHASHGCIGLFRDDIIYVNDLVRAVVGKSDYGYFTEEQIANSVPVHVWPYEATKAPTWLAQP